MLNTNNKRSGDFNVYLRGGFLKLGLNKKMQQKTVGEKRLSGAMNEVPTKKSSAKLGLARVL